MRNRTAHVAMALAVVTGLLVAAVAVVAVLLAPDEARAAPVALEITGSEPGSLRSEAGGTLTIYGSDFTTTTLVRLVGHGLLATTFVNTRTLTALVPPGVPAGQYDLEVSDGGATATLPRAVKVVAATPVPTPTSPPPPGRPVLTIRNYSIEPSRVPAGREFTVRLEIYNTGSRAGENTMVTFPGGTFLPVGESGRVLGQLHINATAVVTQVLRAAAGLASGSYNVQVNLSANDWEGNHYEYPQTIAVEVAGVGEGRPQLLIERASTSPAVIRPGDTFSLTLVLANNGDRTARNVLVGIAAGELAVPASGSNVAPIETIGVNAAETVTLGLVLGEVTRSGRTSLDITLEYADWQGGAYSAKQSVGLEVSATLADRPQLLIERYATEPGGLAPGDTFTLALEVRNVGGGEARRLTLTFGGAGGEKLAPFAPLETGNVRFVEAVAAGAAVHVMQPLALDGAAAPGVYSLPIGLVYEDERGTRHEDSQRISLLVRRRPRLEIGFYEDVGVGLVGVPLRLPVEITNIGRTLVNVSRVEISSDELEIHDGAVYVGPLDGGTSGSLEATAVGQVSGTARLLVTVHYLDDFEQPQVVTAALNVAIHAPEAEGPSSAAEEPQAPSLWSRLRRLLKGLLGLGS